MKVCVRAVSCLLAGVMIGSAVAQVPGSLGKDHDPEPKPLRVRTMLREGSTPVAGVPVHFQPRDFAAARTTVRDGWLVSCDPALERLVAGKLATSDGDGYATVVTPDGVPEGEVFAGAPFRKIAFEPYQDFYVLWVEELARCEVRVRDGAGAPQAGLPLHLLGAGRGTEAAWTDAEGRAVFGIDPAVTVRLDVAPFGWFGPGGDLPSLALAGARDVVWVAPPFGEVRVRAVRNGVPVSTPIDGLWLEPSPGRALESASEPVAGLWLPRVAVGHAVRGQLEVGSLRLPFACEGPTRQGEVVTVDVDIDPPRPKLALHVTGIAGLAPGAQVSVMVRTDTRRFHEYVPVAADGRVLAAFDHERLSGERLCRVDVDLVVDAGHGYSASKAVEMPLANGVLDLGTIELQPSPPLLHGTVDMPGALRPSGGRVTVQPIAEAFAWLQTTGFVADDGTFAVRGPLPRDDEGVVLPVRGWATVGSGVDRCETAAQAAPADGGPVTFVIAPPAAGSLSITLRQGGLLPRLVWFDFVGAGGERRFFDHVRLQWQGNQSNACELRGLPLGRGDLRVLLAPGVELLRIADVVVAGAGTVDPRLQQLDLAPFVQRRRVCVKDEAGVPIGTLHTSYCMPGKEPILWGSSSPDGWVEVVLGPKPHRVMIATPGKEPRSVDEVADGADLVLGPRQMVRVVLQGLPADVPAAWVSVLLRPVERENLRDVVSATLADGCTATLPRPPAGRYVVWITVQRPAGKAGSAASVQFVAPAPFDVEDTTAAPDYTCELDAATIERITAMLAK